MNTYIIHLIRPKAYGVWLNPAHKRRVEIEAATEQDAIRKAMLDNYEYQLSPSLRIQCCFCSSLF